jgi:hypothetical protein
MIAAGRLSDDSKTLDLFNRIDAAASRLDRWRAGIDEGRQARVIGAIPGAIIGFVDSHQAVVKRIAAWLKNEEHKL